MEASKNYEQQLQQFLKQTLRVVISQKLCTWKFDAFNDTVKKLETVNKEFYMLEGGKYVLRSVRAQAEKRTYLPLANKITCLIDGKYWF